jgi:hypothetical protein
MNDATRSGVGMAVSIGLRFYHITLRMADGRVATHADFVRLKDYIEAFIDENNSFSDSKELQRVFSFSKNNLLIDKFNISGYLRYGTYGFESDIVDTGTAEVVHRRKVTEMEQIPLFFKFWFPGGSDYAIAAFQSFSGRSCKQMVVSKLYDVFNRKYPDLRLSFRKIMPQEMQGTGFLRLQLRR